MKLYDSLERRGAEFGLTPKHIINQFRHALPFVVLNSIPKSGTNLLSRLFYSTFIYRRKLHRTVDNYSMLANISHKRNFFMTAHSHFSLSNAHILEDLSVKSIFVYRHPLDVLVSNVNYISKRNSRHRLYYIFQNLSLEEKYRTIWHGGEIDKMRVEGLRSHYDRYSGWLADPSTLAISFEALVGGNGGGSDIERDQTIQSIAQHLNLDEAVFTKARLSMFSQKSRTFLSGKILNYRQDVNVQKIVDPSHFDFSQWGYFY